jgi:hypothetical protein
LLSQINGDNLYPFDQACRITALEWAARLQVPAMVSINFMPNAVYKPETCIRATLEAAKRFNFPLAACRTFLWFSAMIAACPQRDPA